MSVLCSGYYVRITPKTLGDLRDNCGSNKFVLINEHRGRKKIIDSVEVPRMGNFYYKYT